VAGRTNKKQTIAMFSVSAGAGHVRAALALEVAAQKRRSGTATSTSSTSISWNSYHRCSGECMPNPISSSSNAFPRFEDACKTLRKNALRLGKSDAARRVLDIVLAGDRSTCFFQEGLEITLSCLTL
jgi:hypothetical protein